MKYHKCNLCKLKKETLTHYIGVSGKEYPKNEYVNSGSGDVKSGKKDLPKNDYPYSFKYIVEPMFEFCKNY